jgi:hypothetical protein
MTSEERVKLLAAIEAHSREYPDWRLGQLVANVSDWADREIWDVEDAEMLHAAQCHLEQRSTTATSST